MINAIWIHHTLMTRTCLSNLISHHKKHFFVSLATIISIFIEPETLNKYRTCEDASNFERFRKRAKSLFVVAPTAPTDNYNNFTEKVKEYNAKEPFNFVTSNFLKPYSYETVSKLIKSPSNIGFFPFYSINSNRSTC